MRPVSAGLSVVVCVLASVAGVGQESRRAESQPESRPAGVSFERRKSGTPELLVRFARGPCLGSCPVYTIEVFDDGGVRYKGESSVVVEGPAETRLNGDQLDRLVRAFLDRRFFDLGDEYVERDFTCASSASLTLRLGGREKRVAHYHGDMFAPPSLKALEHAVDEIVGSSRWVLTPDEKREWDESVRLYLERASRAESRPSSAPRFDGEEWELYSSRFQVGTITEVDDAKRTAAVVLDASKTAGMGMPLMVIRDQRYVGRVRIVEADGGRMERAVIEHCEPGTTLQRGDLVWKKAP